MASRFETGTYVGGVNAPSVTTEAIEEAKRQVPPQVRALFSLHEREHQLPGVAARLQGGRQCGIPEEGLD